MDWEKIKHTPHYGNLYRAKVPGGWLVLADTWFPGWRAEVDGEHRTVLRANGLHRAVRVRPGDRQVILLPDTAADRLDIDAGDITGRRVEAVLLAAGQPLSLDQILAVFGDADMVDGNDLMIDFDQIRLETGDRITLAFMEDLDLDGLNTREERFFGSAKTMNALAPRLAMMAALSVHSWTGG